MLRRLQQRRCLYTVAPSLQIINLPKANIYDLGAGAGKKPVFRDVEWSVHDGEAWAVVGSKKKKIFEILVGHLRISPPPPPPGGRFPFLSRDPYTAVSLVSFTKHHRGGGGFYDFSARYGAVHDPADRITLRQSVFPDTIPPDPKLVYHTPRERSQSSIDLEAFESLVESMGLKDLLDLPLIALSNGQMRRARIVKAVLSDPALLLLDEPLSGVDAQTRPALLSLLHTLHNSRTPRIILGLRSIEPAGGGGIPDWITHLVYTDGMGDRDLVIGKKEEVMNIVRDHELAKASRVGTLPSSAPVAFPSDGEVLIDMKNVNVKYGARTVLNNINWQIRRGERWHLQGSNGSGKTTLLSLLTGSHPQSYTQEKKYQQQPQDNTNNSSSSSSITHVDSTLILFSHPRPSLPTPHLQSLIGHVSPELFSAFPRRKNLSVWEAIATGFEGGFYVPSSASRGQEAENVGEGVMTPITEQERRWRVSRMWDVLRKLGPTAWGSESGRPASESESESQLEGELLEFKSRPFASLSTDEQRMVLVMRAVVGRQGLILLDEVWSGFGQQDGAGMGEAVRRYLRHEIGEDQAVVVVTHWEEDVPWKREEGLRRLVLEEGGVGMVR